MSRIPGKTIYVLGAGASHHTGAPLLGDFLMTSRLLLDSGAKLVYGDSFNRIFEWIDSLRGSSYYVELDLDNLEHVFSLAEMCSQLGLSKGDEHFRDLLYLICETLDQKCSVRYGSGGGAPDEFYYKFIDEIITMNSERWKLLQKTPDDFNDFEKDVVITFNYDIMLDFAYYRRFSFLPNYCLKIQKPSKNLKVLKLHGSTNWGKCKSCETLHLITPDPKPLDSYTPNEKIPFHMFTYVLKHTACSKCSNGDGLEPVVIPPTWSKVVRDLPLASVWATAVRELSEAFQIVVIGYSMPQTDTFFQYLLTLGSSSNPNLNRVVVVNPDTSPEFKLRYEKVFSRSLKERRRLHFVNNLTFTQLAGTPGNIRPIGSDAEWFPK